MTYHFPGERYENKQARRSAQAGPFKRELLASALTQSVISLPTSPAWWSKVADVIIVPSFPDPTEPIVDIVDAFIEAGYDDETAENLGIWYVR